MLARPEAQPVHSWDELSSDQQAAFEGVLGLLGALAAKDPAEPTAAARSDLRALFRLDAVRYNSVVLLEGGRGSGKTTVFLTLLDHLQRLASGESPRHPFHHVKPIVRLTLQPASGESPKSDGFSRFKGRPWDRILPIGIIDLQAIDRSTHLLLQVGQELERLVRLFEGRLPAGGQEGATCPPAQTETPRRGCAPWEPMASETLGSRIRWNQFARAAALGWDDSLKERRDRLDLETYLVELNEAAVDRGGRGIVESFHRFVSQLVSDYLCWARLTPAETPLFVIGIDDADMNPERSVELLWVLRTLWHPRLAFVLTGDAKLFDLTLRASYLGELRTPLGGLRVNDTDMAELGDRASAWTLAHDALDKAIPRAHRLALEPIAPELRRDFPPGQSPSIGDLIDPRLLPLPATPADKKDEAWPKTLGDYFKENPAALEALPDRPRTLLDFWQWLSRQQASEVVEELWRRALDQEPLSPEDRQRLARAVRRVSKEGNGLEVDSHALGIHFDLTPSLSSWRKGWRLELRTELRLAFSLPRKTPALISERLGQAFVLAHDLANHSPGDRTLGSLELFQGHRAGFAINHSLSGIAFPWPAPSLRGFFGYLQFSKRWAKHLPPPGTKMDDDHLDRAGRAFLQSWIELAPDKPAMPPTEWARLGGQVIAIADRDPSSSREAALVQWARYRAGLLAAPESGLPNDTAKALLDALKTGAKENWEKFRAELVQARLERAAESFREAGQRPPATPVPAIDLHSYLHDIDSQFPSHPWIEAMK